MSNIALGKPAKQSSTFDTFIAKYAVDGNRGTDLIEDKCSHTADVDIDTNPWWLVDLQAVYYIKTVRILNRGMDMYGRGTCSNRRRNTCKTSLNISNTSYIKNVRKRLI